MVFTNIDNVLLTECLAVLALVLIGTILSIIWDIYFAKRIIYFSRLYCYCIGKVKSDPFGNYMEAALYHKLEIIKYTFLVLINIVESLLMLLYSVGYALANEPQSYGHIYFPDRITIPNCTIELIHSKILDLRLIYENPISIVLQSIGKVGLILSLSLAICLMKFLHETFHNISANPFRYIRNHLLATSLVSFAIIITGAVPQLKMIHNITDSIVHLTYFALWVKHARIFCRTLKWRSLELRVRGNSAGLVRRATISYYQFAAVMWCMGVSFAFLILALFLGEYFSLIATVIYYGPCVFNYLYGTHYYEPLLTTHKQIETLHLCYNIESLTATLLTLMAIFIIISQYLLSTLVFFGGILVNKLKYRFGSVRTRYTPSLTQHLLPEQQYS